MENPETEATVELNVLRAYARRRLPDGARPADGHHTGRGEDSRLPPSVDASKGKNKKRKKRWLPTCLRSPERKHENGDMMRCSGYVGAAGQDVDAVANALSRIMDAIHLTPNELETDSDDVIQEIVSLLRESGDELNERIVKSGSLAAVFQNISYNFFQRVTNQFLDQVSPSDIPSTQNVQKAKIALVCEVARRLNMVDKHPMNGVLGFGAKYLQENYSGWVQQNGGWDNVFKDEDAEEVE